ncbi:hypothetical protein TNCT_169231 [Trichonephila clavata]|uniref:Uncharacterized protein n=1 Tax=Trichonephila clavata TaxID=2740835 RepID=A0A8X6K947_TRICU|nr:hypothetical protein TNCT_169231 [Trichonephila clavata]
MLIHFTQRSLIVNDEVGPMSRPAADPECDPLQPGSIWCGTHGHFFRGVKRSVALKKRMEAKGLRYLPQHFFSSCSPSSILLGFSFFNIFLLSIYFSRLQWRRFCMPFDGNVAGFVVKNLRYLTIAIPFKGSKRF